MTDSAPPANVPVPPTPLPPLPPLEPSGSDRKGCLKWGLIGCSGIAVIVVVALIFMSQRMMDVALGTLESTITAACTPDVTPAQRAEFSEAMKAFTSRAKSGKVPTGEMSAFRSKIDAAAAD